MEKPRPGEGRETVRIEKGSEIVVLTCLPGTQLTEIRGLYSLRRFLGISQMRTCCSQEEVENRNPRKQEASEDLLRSMCKPVVESLGLECVRAGGMGRCDPR